jgi:response regulator RpfG family c-di-GMP phosphodiesterase
MQPFSETDIFQTETERRYPDIVDVFLKIENEFAKICNTK